MLDTIARWLNGGISDVRARNHLQQILNPIGDRVSSQCLTSAGLAIKAGGSAVVKAGSVIYAFATAAGAAQGTLVTKTANTDMAALSGTVTNAKFNVFCFFVDSAGTLTSAMGTEGAALANVVFPPFPVGKALIGFVVINPTGTGNFTGGTTPLDDVTVVPNAAYVNTQGAFDPTVMLGAPI